MALLGPRRCGKTTLARSLGGRYFDLEDAGDRTRLDAEWPAVEGAAGLTVLDETQADPGVFARLRGAIDRDRRRNGRFLLLGSVSPSLMNQVSESLAGRLAVAELTPCLAPEIPANRLDRLWVRGGYPDGGVLRAGRFPGWQEEYCRLLAERDLPGWGWSARPQTTHRLLRMLAVAHGQMWNASELGRSLGVSYHTVSGDLEFLEGAWLLRRLMPHGATLGKRLVKTPKVYWRDSGILHALLGLRDDRNLLSQPWVGASWEGFVIEQILGTLQTAGERPDASFLRARDGDEIDLIVNRNGNRWAFEIKLTTQPSPSEFARLETLAGRIGADRIVLVSRLPGLHGSNGRRLADLPSVLRLLRSRVG